MILVYLKYNFNWEKIVIRKCLLSSYSSQCIYPPQMIMLKHVKKNVVVGMALYCGHYCVYESRRPQTAARKAGQNQIFRKIHRKTLLTGFYFNVIDFSVWIWQIASDDQQTKSEHVKELGIS